MGDLEKSVIITTGCGGKKKIDIAPILADPELFGEAVNDVYQMYEREVFDIVLTTKISGSIFASAVASRLGKGMIMVTCIGKNREGYIREDIEGSHSTLTVGMPEGLVKSGLKAAVIVDELSHGRDVKAAIDMAEKQGAKVIKVTGFLEDTEKNARKNVLKGYPVESRLFTEDY